MSLRNDIWYYVRQNEALGICVILNVHIIFLLSSANKCLLKVGAYCAQLEQYQKAIEIYEQVCVHFTFASSDDLMVVFPLSYLVGSKSHTSVLNTYYFKWLKCFHWEADGNVVHYLHAPKI